MPHKLVNGQQVELTADEITARQAEEAAYAAGAFDRAMADLRQKRNIAIASCDWVMLSDSPVADKTAWQNYRQALRDITNSLTTVEEVNTVEFPVKPE